MTKRAFLWVSVCTLSLAWVGAGCSEDASSPSGGGAYGGSGGQGDSGPGGSAGTGGANTGGDGGSQATGGSGGSGGTGAAATLKSGYVSLVQSVMEIQGTQYASHSLSASFVDVSGGAGDWACTTAHDGECVVYDCSGSVTDGGVAAQQASAGTLHISAGGTTITMSPEADGSYTAVTGQSRLWTAGQTLAVQADGDEVPAFTGSVAGVDAALVSAPAFPAAGTAMSISRSQSLTVSWSGQTAGNIFVILARSDTAGAVTHTVSATCTYPASVGSAVVPSTVLSAIPAGDSGSFAVYGGDRAELAAGDWSVVIQEYVPALLPTGYTAAALASFE